MIPFIQNPLYIVHSCFYSEDGEVESEKAVEGQKTEPIIPSIGQVEMDEVYDYENDDTREVNK